MNFKFRLLCLFGMLFPCEIVLPQQQILTGISRYGDFASSASGGMVWEIGADGTGFNVLKNWDYKRTGAPRGNLIAGDNGLFYGITEGLDGPKQALFFVEINPADGQLEAWQRPQAILQINCMPANPMAPAGRLSGVFPQAAIIFFRRSQPAPTGLFMACFIATMSLPPICFEFARTAQRMKC